MLFRVSALEERQWEQRATLETLQLQQAVVSVEEDLRREKCKAQKQVQRIAWTIQVGAYIRVWHNALADTCSNCCKQRSRSGSGVARVCQEHTWAQVHCQLQQQRRSLIQQSAKPANTTTGTCTVADTGRHACKLLPCIHKQADPHVR